MCDVSDASQALIAKAFKLLDSPSFLSDESADVINQGVSRLLRCPDAASLARAGQRVGDRLMAGDLRFLAAAAVLETAAAGTAALREGVPPHPPPTLGNLQKWLANPAAAPPFVLTTFAHIDFFAAVAEHSGNSDEVRAAAAALALVRGSHLAALAAFRAAVPRLSARLTALAADWDQRKITTRDGVTAVMKTSGPSAFCSLSEDCRAVFDEVMSDVATLFYAPLLESPLQTCSVDVSAFSATKYTPKPSGAFVPVSYTPVFAVPAPIINNAWTLAQALASLPVPSPIPTLDSLVTKISPTVWAQYADGTLTAAQLAAAVAKTSAASDLGACFANISQFAKYFARDLLLIPAALGSLGTGAWSAAANPLIPDAVPTVCGLWARTPAPRKTSPWGASKACGGDPPSAWTSPATGKEYAAALAAALDPVVSVSDAALLAAQQARSPLASPVYNSRFAGLTPMCARLAELAVVIVRAAGSATPSVSLAGSTAALQCARSPTLQQWMNSNNFPTDRGTPAAYWRLLADALAPAAPQMIAAAQRSIAAASRPPPPPPTIPALALTIAVFSAAAVTVIVLLLALGARAFIGPATYHYTSHSAGLARAYQKEIHANTII